MFWCPTALAGEHSALNCSVYPSTQSSPEAQQRLLPHDHALDLSPHKQLTPYNVLSANWCNTWAAQSLRLIYMLASQARRLKKQVSQANSARLWHTNKVKKWEKHQDYNGEHTASTSSANPSSSLKAVLPHPTESALWFESYITWQQQNLKLQPLPTVHPANYQASEYFHGRRMGVIL